MSQPPFSFILSLQDFDLTLLPISSEVLLSKPELLAKAVSEYYQAVFQKLGGTANVAVAKGAVHVTWSPSVGEPRNLILEEALTHLQKGNYREAEPLLSALYARFPDDEDVLFNYGMMLSDLGRLDPACRLLKRLVELQPRHSHGWTALGVARSRRQENELALEAFMTAIQLDPENGYAIRNAAAILAETSPSEAIDLFEKAIAILPNDQRTLLGYGSLLLRHGRKADADAVLMKCIDIDPLSDLAEQARSTRTKLAHDLMRESVAGGLRLDVVNYILSALEQFRKLGKVMTGRITMEIAMLGRSGLDINDPSLKYTLKSLPGTYSGLQLVSIMYAGMKELAPNEDAGIDFSREYTEARKLLDAAS